MIAPISSKGCKKVGSSAMLDNQAVRDTVQVDRCHLHGPVRGFHAQPNANVRATGCRNRDHPIGFGDLLFNFQMQVGISSAHPKNVIPRTGKANFMSNVVVDFDVIRRYEIRQPC